MYNLREIQLEAFRSELAKTAAPNWHNIAGGVGALTGAGAAVGGVGGAALGAIKGYRQARNRGEGVLGSLSEGASGAIGGGLKGSLIGAGAGALGGAAAGHLRPELAGKLTQSEIPLLSSGARFGQRQMHGLTGWTPKEGIESIRGGAFEAKQRLQVAQDALRDAKDPKAISAAKDEMTAAHNAVGAAQKAQDMGITSLPGLAKSMKNNGVLPTLKADFANQWAGAGLGAKAMMVGLPAAGMVGTLSSKDVVNEEGQGKAERLGGSIGGLVGGTVGSAVPIIGQMGLGSALSSTGQLIGRGIDKIRGRGAQGDFKRMHTARIDTPAGALQQINPLLEEIK